MFYDMQIMAVAEILKDKDNYLKTIPKQLKQHIFKYKEYPPHFYIFSKNGLPGEKPLGKNELTT